MSHLTQSKNISSLDEFLPSSYLLSSSFSDSWDDECEVAPKRPNSSVVYVPKKPIAQIVPEKPFVAQVYFQEQNDLLQKKIDSFDEEGRLDREIAKLLAELKAMEGEPEKTASAPLDAKKAEREAVKKAAMERKSYQAREDRYFDKINISNKVSKRDSSVELQTSDFSLVAKKKVISKKEQAAIDSRKAQLAAAKMKKEELLAERRRKAAIEDAKRDERKRLVQEERDTKKTIVWAAVVSSWEDLSVEEDEEAKQAEADALAEEEERMNEVRSMVGITSSSAIDEMASKEKDSEREAKEVELMALEDINIKLVSKKKRKVKMIVGSSRIEELKANPEFRSKDAVRNAAFVALAADKTVLAEKAFRSRLCISATTEAPCPHGDKCKFAHSIEEINPRQCEYGLKCRMVRQVKGGGLKNRPTFGDAGKPCKMCYYKHADETTEDYLVRVGIVAGKEEKPAQRPRRVFSSTAVSESVSFASMMRKGLVEEVAAPVVAPVVAPSPVEEEGWTVVGRKSDVVEYVVNGIEEELKVWDIVRANPHISFKIIQTQVMYAGMYSRTC